jgi:hypothetical protein
MPNTTFWIVIRKGWLIFSDSPELAFQSLNDICCIYDFPNLSRVCVKCGENFPVVFPALHTGGIKFSHFSFDFRLIFAVMVTGNLYRNLSNLRFYGFLGIPVSVTFRPRRFINI